MMTFCLFQKTCLMYMIDMIASNSIFKGRNPVIPVRVKMDEMNTFNYN